MALACFFDANILEQTERRTVEMRDVDVGEFTGTHYQQKPARRRKFLPTGEFFIKRRNFEAEKRSAYRDHKAELNTANFSAPAAL